MDNASPVWPGNTRMSTAFSSLMWDTGIHISELFYQRDGGRGAGGCLAGGLGTRRGRPPISDLTWPCVLAAWRA